MKAAELITLAGAHGIDLTQAARHTTARPKSHLSALIERLQRSQIPRDVQARGRQTHVVRRAQWSLAELGQAAEGVPLIPWLAACYRYARDYSCYWALWNQLAIDALELRLKRGWPARVRAAGKDPATQKPTGEQRFYLLDLASLVLDEETNGHVFQAAPVLYAHYMGVEPEVWEEGLSERFGVVKQRFSAWVQTAESIINPRLMDDLEATRERSTPDFPRRERRERLASNVA